MKFFNIFLFLSVFFNLYPKKIGVLTVATGKYIQFVEPMISSAKKYFCTNHDVTFFVFTDKQVLPLRGVVYLYQAKLGWPLDTMMRVEAYDCYKSLYSHFDYLFALDSDMRFVDVVRDEILSDRVGTLHPGFTKKRGSYESRKKSVAYVGAKEGRHYFAGGFYGGSATEFCKINARMMEMIKRDRRNNIIACWHDESYLNRYFIDNSPTKILTSEYCYPDQQRLARLWGIDHLKGKLLALTKDHKVFQK